MRPQEILLWRPARTGAAILRISSAPGATAKRAALAVHRCLLYRRLLDRGLLNHRRSHLHHRRGPQTRHRPLPARVQPSSPPPRRPHPGLCTQCSRKPFPPPPRPRPDLCTKCSQKDPLCRHLLKRPRMQFSRRPLLGRRSPHRHSPRAAQSMAVVRETWISPTARTGARPRVRVGSAPGATARAAPFARLRRHHRYQCRCRRRRHQARHLGRDRLHLRIHHHRTCAGITTMEASHWSASTMQCQYGWSTPAPAATNAQRTLAALPGIIP